jgi:PAS domain S-box-containing protein
VDALRNHEEKANILVVDDRPENVIALNAVLNSPDYNVVNASSGAEALKAVLKREFAVILLDVLMPELDGFETARMIFARPASRRTQIIFLTAVGTDLSSIHEGYALGAVDYLVKPIEPEIVRAKVAVFVDLYRKTRQLKRQEEALRIAERARSARALDEREAEYEATFEKAGVGIAHVSLGGRFLRVNQKFCETARYGKQEALLLKLEDLLPPEEHNVQRQGLERLRRGELERFSVESRLIQKTGRTLRVELTVSLLRDHAGRPKKFIAILEDVSERRRAEEGQQVLANASKVLLNSLEFDSTLGMVAQSVVPVLADYCAICLKETAPQPAQQLSVAHVSPAQAQKLEELIARGGLLDPGQQSRLVPEVDDAFLSAWAPNAADKDALKALDPRSVISVPLKARGQQIGTITLISNTPGRVYAQADLELAEDLARRASLGFENARLYKSAQDLLGVRDEFLSIASHELRTPLTPLQIQLQRMLGVRGHAGIEAMPREQARAMLQRSATQVGRLASLVDSLLDVSRITSGRLTLQHERVDLAALAREVVGRFSEAGNGETEIVVEASAPVICNCDPLRTEQVLVNLVTNATKYGAGAPVQVKVWAQGDRALFSVTDHGIGIPADQLPIIFDRFERGSVGRSYGGLGLGLYIARQIINAHGGSIEVASTLGAGSTFTASVPLHPDVQLSRPVIETNVALQAAGGATPRSALLVEDDEDIRTCVAEILKAEGYRVTEASNGREGLERLSALEQRPDVIILDLMMPVLGGVGFAQEQRKVEGWADIPVVVLSADGRTAESSVPIPGAVFVKKPVNVMDLLEVVGRVCSRPTAVPNVPAVDDRSARVTGN